MKPSRHWVFPCIEELGIRSMADAEARWGTSEAMRLARDRAEKWWEASAAGAPSLRSASLMAGRGLDFTIHAYDCEGMPCRIQQVNKSLRSALLYFDQLVVSDEVTSSVLNDDGTFLDDGNRWRTQVMPALLTATYLYLAGAEDFVVYATFTGADPSTFLGDAQRCRRESKRLARSIRRKSIVTLTSHLSGDGTERDFGLCIVNERLGVHLDQMYFGRNFGRTPNDDEFLADIVPLMSREVATHAIGALARDIAAASALGLPLGASDPMHEALLRRVGRREDARARRTLELRLPILDGLTIRELTSVRAHEAAAFARFRSAVSTAIQLDERDGTDIEAEIIRPELMRIKASLDAARRAFGHQTAAAAGLGAVTAIVGLLSGTLPGATLGAAVAAVANRSAINDYIATRAAVRSSDMYFVWKALGGNFEP